MALREEELNLLFETFEAIVDEKLASDHGRDSSNEMVRSMEMKQMCVNVIAFGETIEEQT